MPEFAGLKISWAATGYDDVARVTIAKGHGGNNYSNDLSFQPGTIGGGRNSGFQALNLALQWGARRIILIGFDADGEGSNLHWYGRNDWPMANNPNALEFVRWATIFDRVAPVIGRIGGEIINASPHSRITAFPKRSIEQALNGWS